MDDNAKLSMIKTLLEISGTSYDTQLGVYLDFAKREILNYLYILVPQPEDVTDVPTKYEMVQVQAVVAGFNLRGAENQSSHTENGISRTFVYSDMVEYIKNNVLPYAKVG